jgi:hypothetical protein
MKPFRATDVTVALLSLLSAISLAGCTSSSFASHPAPPGRTEFTAYFGTSSSDVWAFAPAYASGGFELDHWDGTKWTAVAPTGSIGSACTTTPGKVWVAGSATLGVLDPAGNFQDFSAALPTGPHPERSVSCGRGVALVVLQPDTVNAPNIERLFVFSNDKFSEIPAPAVVGVPNAPLVSIWSDSDLYLGFSNYSSQQQSPEFIRDPGATDFHFDGKLWSRGTTNRIGEIDPKYTAGLSVAGASTVFPRDDVWLNCGPGAVRFDGVTLRPLDGPVPAGVCTFSYAAGHPIVVFRATESPTLNPTAYNCDSGGNCTLIDARGSADVTFDRMQWDGSKWTQNAKVATLKACVGVACGYSGGSQRFGVFGQLDDGTLVLEGPESDSDKTAIWFVQ